MTSKKHRRCLFFRLESMVRGADRRHIIWVLVQMNIIKSLRLECFIADGTKLVWIKYENFFVICWILGKWVTKLQDVGPQSIGQRSSTCMLFYRKKRRTTTSSGSRLQNPFSRNMQALQNYEKYMTSMLDLIGEIPKYSSITGFSSLISMDD